MTISLNNASGGMDAFQQMLDVIGNNIANENTTAFKTSDVQFADMLSQTLNQGASPIGTPNTAGVGGTNPMQVGLGVKVASIYNDFTQGPLEQTGNPTDLAISGAGFFTVSPDQTNGSYFYTRAGNLSTDANGNLVTPNGYYLMGASYPISGTQASSQFSNSTFTGQVSGATATITVPATMNVIGAIDLNQTDTVFNTAGTSITFTAPGATTGTTISVPTGGSITVDGGKFVNITGGSGTAAGMVGTVTSIVVSSASGTSTYTVPQNSTLSFSAGATGTTQFTQTQGSFTVGTDGTLTVSGGETYYLPLANFENPSGLVKDGNSLYSSGFNSGLPIYAQANPAQSQSINQGALEGSNVDLTKEMSNMIVAQTGYEANSKVISTVNSMNQFMIQNV